MSPSGTPSSEPSLSELVVLAASRHGQRKAGVEKAPSTLLAFCASPSNEALVDACLLDVLAEQVASLNKKLISTNRVPILRPEAVARTNEQLHDSIYKSTMKHVRQGHLPKILTLGGDHSIAMGSVSAISNILEEVIQAKVSTAFSKPEPIVFWVDAHADINTPSTTASGNLHGCPVSLLAGLDKEGWKELAAFKWATQRLNVISRPRESFIQTGRLVYIGLRDVDEPEQEIIDNLEILEYPMNRFKEKGRNVRNIITEALQQVDPKGEHPIHISFDIDAIDPQFAASTGTPVPGGLMVEEGVEIIKVLEATGRLVSMDLVEVNPSLGSQQDVEITLQSAAKLIETFNGV